MQQKYFVNANKERNWGNSRTLLHNHLYGNYRLQAVINGPSNFFSKPFKEAAKNFRDADFDHETKLIMYHNVLYKKYIASIYMRFYQKQKRALLYRGFCWNRNLHNTAVI